MGSKRKRGPFWSIILLLTWFSMAHAAKDPWPDRLYDTTGLEISGFAEMRQGWRLTDNTHQKTTSISEGRLQLEVGKDLDWGILQIKGDLVGDLVEEETRGELREFNLSFSPVDIMDVKIGRQTLTWGTGDLLFINDLFPKDWKSFFIGRDDEYLKAPSDALKASWFFDIADIDLVYTPLFRGSDYIDGTRLSYWNPMLGRTAGRDHILRDDEKNHYFDHSELAMRISKRIASHELALYGYYGYWQTPEGFDRQSGRLTYPRLGVYGASLRSPLLGGIGNIEIGYYDSFDDPGGDDPAVRNSEYRFLAGFERELVSELTASFQYYLERMDDFKAYKRSSGAQVLKDELRHLVTLRLTQLLFSQNLRLSLFTYYSPSDADFYLRPKVHYKISDDLALEVGGNIFGGKDENTFFGQFEDNSNAYLAVRWNF